MIKIMNNDHERLVYNSMIKIMITKPKKTPDHLVMIIQLMNIFMTCKDCAKRANSTPSQFNLGTADANLRYEQSIS